MQATTPPYRPEIDTLRAIAVLLVIFFHLDFRLFASGFIGVDIFFVISGYLITKNISTQLQNNTFSLREFYVRRFRRLFPAVLVTIAVTLAIGFFVLPPEDLKNLSQYAFASIFSLGNVRALMGTGYWEPASRSQPLLHLWSLGVEEQFYLFWPLLLGFIFAKTKGKNYKDIALKTLAAMSFASLVLTKAFTHFYEAAVFYLPFFRIWEFGAGAILALGISQLANFDRQKATLATACGFLGLIWFVGFSGVYRFLGANAIVPILCSCLIIEFSHRSVFAKILQWTPAVFIGRMSYSLYLVHWPIIVYANYISMTGIRDFSNLTKAGLLLACFVSALALRFFVEEPFRYKQTAEKQMPRFAVPAFAAFSVIVLVTAVTTHFLKGWPSRIPPQELTQVTSEASEVLCYEISLEFSRQDFVCRFGAPIEDKKIDVVLIGDSHARHLLPGLHAYYLAKGMSGLFSEGQGALPIPGGESGVSKVKYRPFDKAFEYVLREKPSLLILSARWDTHIKWRTADTKPGATNLFFYGQHQKESAESSQAAIYDGLKSLYQRLAKSNVQTLLVGQVPFPGRNLKDCYERPPFFNFDRAKCLQLSSQEQIEYHKDFSDMISKLNSELPNLKFLNLVKDMCQGENCDVATDLYTDTNHIGANGARYVTNKYLKPTLDSYLAH